MGEYTLTRGNPKVYPEGTLTSQKGSAKYARRASEATFEESKNRADDQKGPCWKAKTSKGRKVKKSLMKLRFFMKKSSFTCKTYTFWQHCRADVHTSQAFLMVFLATCICTCKTEGKTQIDRCNVKKLIVFLKFFWATCICTCDSHSKVQVGRANVENTACF